MFTQSVFLLLVGMMVSSSLAADPVADSLNDRRMQDEYRPAVRMLPQPKAATLPLSDTENKTVSLSKDQLLQHPDLLVRAMMAALLYNRSEHTALLLPLYRQLPEPLRDALIEDWAQAQLERADGRHGRAVRLYRRVLSERPDLLPVRLQLAASLFEDKQYAAAEDQFRRLRSETRLPESVHTQIDQYLAAIRNSSLWTFHGGLTYLNDRNLNNVPSNSDLGGGFRTDPPEAGNGVAMSLGADKQYTWGSGLFHEVRADINGKYYWNNKKYNELAARAAVGAGYQNARNRIVLLPFAEYNWYAGGSKNSRHLHRFSRSYGIGIESSRYFSPKWQGSVQAEYSRRIYRSRPHLNGHTAFASATFTYQPHARRYWFAGSDYTRLRSRDRDDAYNRYGWRIGLGQEWGRGLSGRLTLSYARKRHLAPNFFNSVQNNREYGVGISLWHRRLHWLGITPRLSWHYQNNRSNQALYTYKRQRLFIELGKQF